MTLKMALSSNEKKHYVEFALPGAGLDIKQWFFDQKEWFSLAELVLRD